MAVAVRVYWWDVYVLGLRFLAPPAVTSASEVFTQTFVARLQWRLKSKVTCARAESRTAVQNVDVPIPRVRWYLRCDPVDPTRAHF